jgi:hypothetical protein
VSPQQDGVLAPEYLNCRSLDLGYTGVPLVSQKKWNCKFCEHTEMSHLCLASRIHFIYLFYFLRSLSRAPYHEDQPQYPGLWHSGSPSARSFSCSPSPPPPPFTQYPSPLRSLVRDGQTSPLRPSLVAHVLHYPPPPTRTAL